MATSDTKPAQPTAPSNASVSQAIVPSRRLPILTRLKFAIQAWAFKTFVTTALGIMRIVRASKFRAIAATYTKRYSIRPMLESRVFVPKTYKSGTKLPLYIDIHGGGFAICDPQTDDHFCRYFSDEFGYLVVSIDYRKAPSAPFPIPVHDCAELVRAVLADSDLPIDHDRVVVGGFSAGGNLSLAVAQFEDLKQKIKGVVPIYPVTDFTSVYRDGFKTTKDGKEDVLKRMTQLFNWAYCYGLPNLKDTKLSSVYATREMLPQKMYFVGAEDDCLCNEAKVLAKSLAGIESSEMDDKLSWNKNGVWWEMIPDQQHGFTHMEASGQKEIERTQVCNALYKRIDTWIKQSVFAK